MCFGYFECLGEFCGYSRVLCGILCVVLMFFFFSVFWLYWLSFMGISGCFECFFDVLA